MKSPFIVGSVIAVAIGGAIAVATALVISGCSSSPQSTPRVSSNTTTLSLVSRGKPTPSQGITSAYTPTRTSAAPMAIAVAVTIPFRASPTSAAPTWGINNDTAEATGFPLR